MGDCPNVNHPASWGRQCAGTEAFQPRARGRSQGCCKEERGSSGTDPLPAQLLLAPIVSAAENKMMLICIVMTHFNFISMCFNNTYTLYFHI